MSKSLLEIYLERKKVCTDTRKIQDGAIFFALKGENFNGNKFAKKALEEGCSYAVIDEDEYATGDHYILVKDVLKSLQELATNYRLISKAKFIGITGSNGKTTTKELMRDVLMKKYKVHATKGNLNNHIGVPLTLLEIADNTDVAIIEMGANHQGEIRELSNIAMPDFGIITNIGKAHLEGFGGIEGVKKGKGELFDFLKKNKGTAFVNLDCEFLDEMSANLKRNIYNSEGGPFQIHITQNVPTLSVDFTINDEKHSIHSQMTGEYNIHNIATAIAIGHYFGVRPEHIAEAVSKYTPDNNRSQLHKTERNSLILDAYNANPSSLKEALLNLSKMEAENKFFIIGDMLELGEYSDIEHEQILAEASRLGLKGITVGEKFQSVLNSSNFPSFADTASAAQYLQSKPLEDCLVLIKGSRGIKLEDLVKFL